MSKRGTHEILAGVLRAASNGMRMTHIMYQTGLNWGIVRNYLRLAEKWELVEEREEFYHTTRQGREYMQRYEALLALTGKVPPQPISKGGGT